MILPITFPDWKVVDASQPAAHEAVPVELPIFVAVGAEPITAVVMPFIGEANRDAVAVEGPKLLDEPVIKLPIPLAGEKGDDLTAASNELGTVAPNWLRVLRGAIGGVYNDLETMREWSAICRMSQ